MSSIILNYSIINRQLMRDNKNIKFYHGVNNELVFHSTIVKFCALASFTISLSIATSKCNGMVLQLECYGLNVSYFDCRWIGDYSNEMERVVDINHKNNNTYIYINMMMNLFMNIN